MQQLLARQLEVQAHLPQSTEDSDKDSDEDEDDDEDEDCDEDCDEEGDDGEGTRYDARMTDDSRGGSHHGRYRCPYSKCRRKTPFRSRRGLNVHYQRRISLATSLEASKLIMRIQTPNAMRSVSSVANPSPECGNSSGINANPIGDERTKPKSIIEKRGVPSSASMQTKNLKQCWPGRNSTLQTEMVLKSESLRRAAIQSQILRDKWCIAAHIRQFRIQITLTVIFHPHVLPSPSKFRIAVSPSNTASMPSLSRQLDGSATASGPLANPNFLLPLSHGVEAPPSFASGGMSAPIFHDVTIPPYYQPPMFSLPSNTPHQSYSTANQHTPSTGMLPAISLDNQAGDPGEVERTSY